MGSRASPYSRYSVRDVSVPHALPAQPHAEDRMVEAAPAARAEHPIGAGSWPLQAEWVPCGADSCAVARRIVPPVPLPVLVPPLVVELQSLDCTEHHKHFPWTREKVQHHVSPQIN